MKKPLLISIIFIKTGILFSQDPANENARYNPRDFYLPLFNPPAENEFRSAKGTPGPKYWQNTTSYLIHATLSEKDTTLTGEVTISYTNNSPDQLDSP